MTVVGKEMIETATDTPEGKVVVDEEAEDLSEMTLGGGLVDRAVHVEGAGIVVSLVSIAVSLFNLPQCYFYR